MEPWEEPARLLPVPLPPVRGEVLGWYLHRLAKANHTLPGRIGLTLFPCTGTMIDRRTDALWHWPAQALPRFSIMTGLTENELRDRLPAIADAEARAADTDVRVRRRYYVPCPQCMRSRYGISETVLAHLPHSLRLCHRHKVWLDSAHHYPIGHLPELITAQKKHLRLAHRLSGTLATATAEASRLIQGWFVTWAQPELQKRWRSRLAQIPPAPRQPEYSNLVRRRVRDYEFIATYPEFVTMLGLIGDENWRVQRIPASQEVTPEAHKNAIDAVFAEAAHRLGVTTLRPSRGGRLFSPASRASSFHHDALFRWVDPRGRVPTG